MNDAPKNVDDAKGRLKEGAGTVTGDKSLKNEGRVDRASGAVKHGVDKVKDALKGDPERRR
jgi:uncharacterized protein YjbJ (UPF0337 family)